MKTVTGALVVPSMMVAAAALYWTDAAGLSVEATVFPAILTAALALALVAAVAGEWREAAGDGDRAAGGLGHALRSWSVVLLPVPLIASWRLIGAMPALAVYLLCLLLVLGERRLLWLVGVPAVLGLGLVKVFETMLYVRIPHTPWPF